MKRIRKKIAAALLAAGMLISEGSIFSGIPLQASAADSIVNRIDITGFTLPVPGESPDTELEIHTNCGDNFTAYVKWARFDRNGDFDPLAYVSLRYNDTFSPDHDYSIHIVLRSEAYEFNHFYECEPGELIITVNGIDVTDYIHDATRAYYPDEDYEYIKHEIDLFLGGYYPRVIPENSSAEGVRLSLGEKIGVKFYVNPSAEAAKARLTGPNGTVIYDNLLWNPALMHNTAYEGMYEIEPKGLYCLPYDVYPTQAGKPITLELLDSQDKRISLYNSEGKRIENDTLVYSVNDYIDGYYALNPGVRENAVYTKDYTCPDYEDAGAGDQLEARLIVAMEQYFRSLSNYFNHTDLAIAGIQDVTDDCFDPYKPNLYGRKLSLVLDSKTALKIYDDSSETTAFFTHSVYDWKLDNFSKTDNYFYIPAIKPQHLSWTRYFKIGNDKLNFSALSYCWLAMHKSTDSDLQAVAKSIYVYYKMSEEYYNYYTYLLEQLGIN